MAGHRPRPRTIFVYKFDGIDRAVHNFRAMLERFDDPFSEVAGYGAEGL